MGALLDVLRAAEKVDHQLVTDPHAFFVEAIRLAIRVPKKDFPGDNEGLAWQVLDWLLSEKGLIRIALVEAVFDSSGKGRKLSTPFAVENNNWSYWNDSHLEKYLNERFRSYSPPHTDLLWRWLVEKGRLLEAAECLLHGIALDPNR